MKAKWIKYVRPGVIIYLRQVGTKKLWSYRYRWTDEYGQRHDVFRSSKTPDLNVAKDRSYLNYKSKVEKDAPVTAWDGRMPNCQELIDCYIEHIGTEDGARTSPVTVKCNANAFSRLLRLAFNREPGQISAAELNGEAVKRWRQVRYAERGLTYGADEDLRLNYSLNSTWQHVKGLFSRAAMRLYARELGLRVDLKGFLVVSRLEEFDTRYTPIAAGVVAAMDRDSLELPVQERLAYELARFCGLTKREILSARWNWIEGGAEAPVLAIRYRPGSPDGRVRAWKSKQNSKHGQIAIDPAMVAEWRMLAPCNDPWGYILPREHVTDAENVIRRVNAWLGEYLPDRQKKLHELRKHAGSEVLTRTRNLVEAAAFLRDSVDTARKHYASLLKPVSGLSRYEVPEVRESRAQ